MKYYEDIFPLLLYILGTILLIALIVLVIKLIKTLKKVDTAIDDYNDKAQKLDGVFNIIDTATDTISSVSDKIVSGIIKGITGLFKKRGKSDEDEEE